MPFIAFTPDYAILGYPILPILIGKSNSLLDHQNAEMPTIAKYV